MGGASHDSTASHVQLLAFSQQGAVMRRRQAIGGVVSFALVLLQTRILRAQVIARGIVIGLLDAGDRPEYVDAGGLVAYGPLYPDLLRRAASYVDKMLKGAKPGAMPIEQPTTFELVINANTARALGVAIPPSMLARVNRVIQ